jgi:hypothetical protein
MSNLRRVRPDCGSKHLLSVKETDDLDMLIALHTVSDWLVISIRSWSELDELYSRTYALMEIAVEPDHIKTL